MSFSINNNMLNTISSLVSPTVRTPFRPKSSRLDNRRRQVPASVYRLIYYAFTCLFHIASCCPPFWYFLQFCGFFGDRIIIP